MGRKALVAAGMVAAVVIAGTVVAMRTEGRGASPDGAATAVVDDNSAAGERGVPPLARAEPALGQDQTGRVPPVGGTIDPAGARIVQTADLSVEVGEGRFGSAFDRVAAIAATHGGYVTSSTTATSEGGRGRPDSGQLTVRVPADRFEAARSALRQLGTVDQESLRGEDVSGRLVDYEARLRSLQVQEESLRALLGRAGDVGEILQVQTALFDVRQQIEQLEAQQSQLEQAAALATVNVALYEPGAGPVRDPEPQPAHDLATSLRRARDGALAVIGGMIVVLGWLTPLAVLATGVWGSLRLRRRSPRSTGPAPSTA